MGKIYTDYDEYLQDAYEQQTDTDNSNERAQETTRQQGEE